MDQQTATLDGKHWRCHVAYRINEVIAIFSDHAVITNGRAGR